jgi:hypothetical protein
MYHKELKPKTYDLTSTIFHPHTIIPLIKFIDETTLGKNNRTLGRKRKKESIKK